MNEQVILGWKRLNRRITLSNAESLKVLRALIDAATEELRTIQNAMVETASVKTIAKSPAVIQRQAERKERAKMFLSLYDSFVINGRPIGDIYYHELAALVKERQAKIKTMFVELSLLNQLQKHGNPTKPTKIRDMVTVATLRSMIFKAQSEAEPAPAAQTKQRKKASSAAHPH